MSTTLRHKRKARARILLSIWLIWIFALLVMGLLQPQEPVVWAIVLACTAAISFVLLTDPKPLGFLLMLGFLQRVFWLWLDLQTSAPVFSSGADTEDFYLTAITIYREPGLLSETLRLGSFSKPAALLFMLAGPHRVIVQFTNVLLGVSTLILLARSLAMFHVSDRTRNLIVGVVALMPLGAILQSIFLRESAVAFFVAVSIYGFSLYLIRGSATGIALALGGLAFAAYFHAGVIGLAIGYFVALLLYDRQSGRMNLSIGRLALAVPLTAAFTAFLMFFSDQFLLKFRSVSSVDDILATAERSSGGSAYSAEGSVAGGGFTPRVFSRMVNFVGSPFPWQWRGLEDIISFVFDASVFIALSILVLSALRSGPGQKKSVLVLFSIALVGALFIFAVGTGNTGTAMRHRQKLVVPFAVAGALAVDIRAPNRRKNPPGTGDAPTKLTLPDIQGTSGSIHRT